MATLIERPSGKNQAWMISFINEKKQRKTISLSKQKYGRKTAEQLKEAVEALVYNLANKIPVPNKDVERWILAASPEIQEKLAKVGLIHQLESHTCKELWDSFLKDKRKHIKDSTSRTYDHVKRRFFAFFKEKEYVESVTKERMEEFKAAQLETHGEATVCGTITKLRTIFNWAVKKGWIQESPMIGVSRGSFVNRQNDRFIKAEEYRRLLEYCPCLEWRVILALARYGGLRCPSEVLRLRWGDINWAEGSLTVTSPKTEHHKGKESRVIPLFPEIKEELNELYFRDESEGMEFVINRYRDPERTNLGTQFARIVHQAGLPPIKRPFDNMRMSRSNEVKAKFGVYYETQWIGHSSKVGMDHYYDILPDDIQRGAEWTTSPMDSKPEAGSSPERPKKGKSPEKNTAEKSAE